MANRTVVIDGANGFVGSNLARVQAGRGRSVVALARGTSEETLEAIQGALVEPDEPAFTDRCHPVSYVLDQADLGLDDAGLAEVFGDPCDYWHTAASVSLSSRNPAELFATNVEGTRSALEAFRRHASPGSRFFQVSTAYSCGHHDGEAPEGWHETADWSAFRTYYEASKREAELVFRSFREEHGVSGTVVRLGQVVGHSQTGETSSLYGIYDLIRALARISHRHPDQKVRVTAAPNATLNLVPVDRCTDWMCRVGDLDEVPWNPPIVHLVDRSGIPADVVAAAISNYLPIELVLVPEDELPANEMSAFERLVAARTSFTGRYVSHRIDFARNNLDAILGDDDRAALDVDELDRIVRTFVASPYCAPVGR